MFMCMYMLMCMCIFAHMCIHTWPGAGIEIYLCTFAHMCTQTGTGVCSCVHSVKSHCTLFSAYCTLHFAGTVTDACICALVRIFMYVYTPRHGCGACVYIYGELLGILAWRQFCPLPLWVL